MRVLLIGEMNGGEGTFVKNLINNPPDGVQYSYIFSNQNGNAIGTCTYKKCEKLLNIFNSKIIGAGMSIKIVKIKENYDLIHLHGLATKLIMKNRSAIIFSASGNLWQGLIDFYNYNKFKFYKGYFGSRILYKILGITDRIHNNRQVHKLVTWSNFVRKSYIKLGVPSEKIDVIYPGFPDHGYRVNQKVDNINFLFISGQNKFQRKGGYLVLKAFKQLLNQYSNINLIIVGDKPEILINDKRIKYLGFVNLKTLYNLVYPKINMLVLPTYADGFPTVCAEVQGYGIPVITTDIWSNPEIVVDKKTGFIISPGDVNSLLKYMKYFAENEELRVKMGMAARDNFLKKFSIRIMQSKYNNLYKSLLEELR